MKKQCPECNDPIVGRTDKKFCSDGCRNSFNNRVNKDQKNLIRNINNRLRKNWRILESLNPNQKTKSTRDKLILQKALILIILQVFIQPKLALSIILCMIRVIYHLENNYYAIVKRE